MNRMRWCIAGGCFLLLWLIAGTVWGPVIQDRLQKQATAVLRTEGGEALAGVAVEVHGQSVRLAGKVRREEERARVVQMMEQQVRSGTPLAAGLGGGLNPVSEVVENVEVSPYPPGWVLLVSHGGRGQLLGVAANEYEARDATVQITNFWLNQGGRLEGTVSVRPDLFDESPTAEKTLRGVPKPFPFATPLAVPGLNEKPADGEARTSSEQLQVARLGSTWETLNVEAEPEVLERQVRRVGATEEDWKQRIWPALEKVRQSRAGEKARQAEEERLAKLPLPHLFFAVRDSRILLRGEVATAAIKRELMTAMVAMYPDWRVLDDVRINEGRRPTAQFAPLTTALLPERGADGKPVKEGKAFALGVAGQPWVPVDWQVGADSRPWKEKLPTGLPEALLIEDSRVVIEWLQGGFKGIPVLPAKLQPAFLLLGLLPDRVLVTGQVAEESTRMQLIEALGKTYGSHVRIVSDNLQVRGNCEPSGEVLQTTLSLPILASVGKAGALAFARPGEVWTQRAMTPTILEPGGLGKSGLLPKTFPAALAEDAMLELSDYFRAAEANPQALGPAASASTAAMPARATSGTADEATGNREDESEALPLPRSSPSSLPSRAKTVPRARP